MIWNNIIDVWHPSVSGDNVSMPQNYASTADVGLASVMAVYAHMGLTV